MLVSRRVTEDAQVSGFLPILGPEILSGWGKERRL
jgi:hypothetical protein